MTAAWRTAPLPLLLIGLAVVAVLANVPGTVEAQTPPNQAPTGLPIVLAVAEGAPILFADTSHIADGNGIPFTGDASDLIAFTYAYRWIRVDGANETNVGGNSPKYRLVDADIGTLIKVQVSYTDRDGHDESLTSVPFGPVVRPAALPSPATLVGNTGQSASATATITHQYAMEFTLGSHGQGYELSSVSIELAAVPFSLTVSLWIGDHSVHSSVPATKLFDFRNPASFQVGRNEFTAPAGVLVHQRVRYYIVLSDFGSTLSINETTSDNEDAGGEAGAELGNTACVRALDKTGLWESSCSRDSVLRLAVEGSQRTSGILASTFAQPFMGNQEIISIGDDCCFEMGAGGADRYLIRGFSWNTDDTTPRGGGISNPFHLVAGTSSTEGAKLFRVINTRSEAGITEWTAPQGATVAGGSSKRYTFAQNLTTYLDHIGDSARLGGILTRTWGIESGEADKPSAPGVTLSDHVDIELGGAPLVAVLGEPLDAMVSNLGRNNNGYVSIGGADMVVSQGFTTGSDEDDYPLTGIGVNIEGSGAQIPDNARSVSAAVHADSSGKPGAKLFDLVSPAEYAAGLSFFEAPRGTVLDPSTSYVLVWTYNAGSGHRLQRTAINGEDSGKLAGFSIADAYYLGADVDNLSVDTGGNALEIAVYGSQVNKLATGRPAVYPSADGAGILLADTFGIEDPNGVLVYSSTDEEFVRSVEWSYQWIRVDGESQAETEIGADSLRYQPVDADLGHLIKVRVEFTDQAGYAEAVTSLPFGPIAEAGPSAYPSTLVGNTDQLEPLELLSGFDLHSSNSRASGTWSDGTTIWVANSASGGSGKVFAYTLADGKRDSNKDIGSGSIGNHPQSVCSNGTTMWAGVDDALFDTKLYAYKLSDLSRDAGKDITPHSSNDEPRGIWCDASTVWVIEEDSTDKIFAYKLADGTRDSSKDFNTIDAASNNLPLGLWSDGTTMWVSDRTDNKLYAYKMSDKSRDADKDITLRSGNTSAYGIWSDGQTMLVVDSGDDKLYAYEMPGAEEAHEAALQASAAEPAGQTAIITQQYAQGFRLGDHGQGYELTSVEIDLAALPSSLTVSLWIGALPGYEVGTEGNQVSQDSGPVYRLFDFANPGAFKVGLNRFTAPAGAFAYQNVNYWIVLSDFGSSLQVKETASDAEDGGGEPGAVVFDEARVRALSETGPWRSSAARAGVLRLVLKGSKRTSGILASNYTQGLDTPGNRLEGRRGRDANHARRSGSLPDPRVFLALGRHHTR